MTDDPQAPEPTEQHRWLARLVGDWTYESGEGDARSEGVETVRSLGDFWVVAEGSMPGGTYLSNIGFDPSSGRFTGQWIGSMMSHHWVYDGALSSDRRTLHLMSRGPAFDGSGGVRTYRDSIEIVSDDERRQRGEWQGEDGRWTEMYVTTYRRKG